jgi:hypothetical protein
MGCTFSRQGRQLRPNFTYQAMLAGPDNAVLHQSIHLRIYHVWGRFSARSDILALAALPVSFGQLLLPSAAGA